MRMEEALALDSKPLLWKALPVIAATGVLLPGEV
jgi:hypothetical protein